MSHIPAAADFTNSLTIVINENHPEHTATFTVPETLLTEKSEFFKAACRNEWKEASSRIVKLPGVDVTAFNAYLNWIYREKVTISLRHALDGHPTTAAEARPALCDLVQLWLLADRLADVQLRKLATNAMVRVLGWVSANDQAWTEAITPDMAVIVWSKTTSGRTLRRLTVDLYAERVQADYLERVRDELHPEFVKDLMVKVIRVKDEKEDINIFHGDICNYHENEGQEDLRCKRDAIRLE